MKKVTTSGQTPQAEAQQLDEYKNKIIDQAERFYNNRMIQLLWIMGFGIAIVGIIVPILLESQREKSFDRELDIRLAELRKYSEGKTGEVEAELRKYSEKQTKELEAELRKEIYIPLSLAFLELGGLFSGQKSPAACGLELHSYVLAMKYDIISQCLGTSLDASRIIMLFTSDDRGDKITLKHLEEIERIIETIEEDVKKIIDKKKRENMESELRELQTYIHSLIYKKKQTPPQSSPQ